MPDVVDSNGLQVKTLAEIVADLGAGLQAIYGTDINLDSNSPDGQLVNLFAQAGVDLRELLVATNNTFSVPASFGVFLDQRVALNGMTRKSGTHTLTNVTVTTTGAVNLTGVDALATDPTAQVYTVADGNGVQYQLIATTSIVSSGAHILAFQAKDVGVIQPVQNTITVQVSLVAGVTAVNNPSVATSLGTAEETDGQLRVRQAKMFKLGSLGPSDAIEAALLSISDVTDAFVAQNDTDSESGGVPARSIWAIVTGGTDAEIGTAIYNKKAPGCGMKGSSSYVVTRPNGTSFTALWDASIAENLYMKFTITARVPGITFDAAAIKTAIVAQLLYKLNQSASIGDVITIMNAINPNAILSVVGVSADGMSYVDILPPSDFQHYFTLSTGNIDVTIP